MFGIQRLIILDWSVFLHRAIFALKFNPEVPATYTAQSMILGALARIGVEPDDVVMFVCDGRHSWRKEIEEAYKGNRAAHREESGLDWDFWFQKFDELRDRLNRNTNWIFVGPIEHIEADDIAAVACRVFKEVPEIVLVTIDSDWEQMWAIHPGVKIFSLQSKQWKVRPAEYNVYAELAKKVNKEVSDNLVTSVTTSEEYDKRLMCVDLTRLPEWVEKAVTEVLSSQSLYEKNISPELMPSKSLQPRFDALYNDKSKQIIYEVQVQKAEAKEARAKKKKAEAKEKEKRQKEREAKRAVKLQAQMQKAQAKQLKGVKNGKVCSSSV
jgi:hypothetical protein